MASKRASQEVYQVMNGIDMPREDIGQLWAALSNRFELFSFLFRDHTEKIQSGKYTLYITPNHRNHSITAPDYKFDDCSFVDGKYREEKRVYEFVRGWMACHKTSQV